ncbi:hypothetical protein ACU686_09695 [Yinghuangia aomiensis]
MINIAAIPAPLHMAEGLVVVDLIRQGRVGIVSRPLAARPCETAHRNGPHAARGVESARP